MKEVILTPEGFKKLKEEIEHLSNHKRREVAERIRVARQFGDIAENSEYDDAKNDQALLEHRIAILEERMANCSRDHQEGRRQGRRLGRLAREAPDVSAKETVEYYIVGSAEANPAEHKLSNESPVGKAIIGKKKGETVEVTTPRGKALKYKIMDIKAAYGLEESLTTFFDLFDPERLRVEAGKAHLHGVVSLTDLVIHSA